MNNNLSAEKWLTQGKRNKFITFLFGPIYKHRVLIKGHRYKIGEKISYLKRLTLAFRAGAYLGFLPDEDKLNKLNKERKKLWIALKFQWEQ